MFYQAVQVLEPEDHEQFFNAMELQNRDELGKNEEFSYLYPSLDDPEFNLKIAKTIPIYKGKRSKLCNSNY